MTQILRIDSSARHEGSVTRTLTGRVAERLGGAVTHLDLAETPLPQVDKTWVAANFTAADDRSEAQRAVLAQSDALIAQLKAADVVVIGLPVYNFTVPAALKAWIDLVARAGVTFRYTEDGPVGLLEGKRAVIAMASGGTEAGSPVDFATPYLKHIMGFLGIEDVSLITADTLMVDAEAAHAKAERQLAGIAA
jgi:FMN-dependent NADH-azoreductase